MEPASQVKDAGEGVIPVLSHGGVGSDISLDLSDASLKETLVLNTDLETIVRINSPMTIRMSLGPLNPNVIPAPTIATEIKINPNQPEYWKVRKNEAIAMITEDGATFDIVNIIIVS